MLVTQMVQPDFPKLTVKNRETHIFEVSAWEPNKIEVPLLVYHVLEETAAYASLLSNAWGFL